MLYRRIRPLKDLAVKKRVFRRKRRRRTRDEIFTKPHYCIPVGGSKYFEMSGQGILSSGSFI